MMQRDEHSSEFWTPLQHDEAEMTGHEMLSNLFRYHVSFQPSQIPSTTHHGSDFIENSKANLYNENEFCVVGPCHKKNGHVCQILEEGNLVDYILCEPNNLSGSLKEDRKKLMAAMKNFVDINVSVAR